MLHIWYSALIQDHLFRSLRNTILPLIQDMCIKTERQEPATLCSKRWTYFTCSLRLALYLEQWKQLMSYFPVSDMLTTSEAIEARHATVLAPSRKDYPERALYGQSPRWRICTLRFRSDGILLPFGASREEFDIPNPYFSQFNSNHTFLILTKSLGPFIKRRIRGP